MGDNEPGAPPVRILPARERANYMSDRATTNFGVMLSCDPGEPLLVVGYSMGWRPPYDDHLSIVRDVAFVEPVNLADWSGDLGFAVYQHVAQLPRVLPFD